jgi:predicted NBD/HSP70 family sugar kinase
LVNDLRKENLIKNSEKAVITNRVGKPGQYLEIDNEYTYFLGLYLEETFIDAHVIGIADQEIHYQRIPVGDCPASILTEKVIGIITHFTLMYEKIQGVGIAVKSVVDCEGNLSSFKRTVMDQQVPKIWKVDGFSKTIRNSFPNLSVVVENDANCAAVYCQTAFKTACATSIVFIINEKPFGIGCGIMIDGKLFKGTNGSAGEIFFSDRSIQTLVEKKTKGQDPIQLMKILKESILKAVYLFDPQQVYLTGGLFDDMAEATQREIKTLFESTPYLFEVIAQQHVSYPAKGAVLLVADACFERILANMDRR